MLRLITNADHLQEVLAPALMQCRHRLFIATADVKELHLPTGGPSHEAASILDVFEEMSRRSVQVSLLHSGVPSGPFLGRLKQGLPANLRMRRCVRVHAKAVIVDGLWMYLGSANLTGAGLGAKSSRRRNFEAGVWTNDLPLIDPLTDMLEGIWNGSQCGDCGRKDHCPIPLEEPQLA